MIQKTGPPWQNKKSNHEPGRTPQPRTPNPDLPYSNLSTVSIPSCTSAVNQQKASGSSQEVEAASTHAPSQQKECMKLIYMGPTVPCPCSMLQRRGPPQHTSDSVLKTASSLAIAATAAAIAATAAARAAVAVAAVVDVLVDGSKVQRDFCGIKHLSIQQCCLLPHV